MVRNDFLSIWFSIIFTVTLYFLEPVTNFPYFFHMMCLFIAIPIINFYRSFRKFGALGCPVLSFSTSKIILYGQESSSEVNVYADDEVHIVGLKNNRFIRFVNKKHGNRELKLNKPISQKLIRFIVNRLKNKHKVIHEDYPNILSQFRGDF